MTISLKPLFEEIYQAKDEDDLRSRFLSPLISSKALTVIKEQTEQPMLELGKVLD